MIDLFEKVLVDFKAKETPESVLLVGDDQSLIRVVLAWPKVPLLPADKIPAFCEGWNEIARWNWLWQCVQYRKWELENTVGIIPNLENSMRMLIANRIIYPDGLVQDYVVRYLRDRVVKLFESKPRTRSRKT